MLALAMRLGGRKVPAKKKSARGVGATAGRAHSSHGRVCAGGGVGAEQKKAGARRLRRSEKKSRQFARSDLGWRCCTSARRCCGQGLGRTLYRPLEAV